MGPIRDLCGLSGQGLDVGDVDTGFFPEFFACVHSCSFLFIYVEFNVF